MRHAACRCGALRAECSGEPVRVSVCHCHDCQRRTGSAFSAQARFPAAAVIMEGEARTYTHIADSGNKGRFHFCPACGSTIAYEIDAMPGLIAIPFGALAGTDLPPPVYSIYESRKADWVSIVGDGVEHLD